MCSSDLEVEVKFRQEATVLVGHVVSRHLGMIDRDFGIRREIKAVEPVSYTHLLGMILSVSRQNDEQSHDMPKSESIYEDVYKRQWFTTCVKATNASIRRANWGAARSD